MITSGRENAKNMSCLTLCYPCFCAWWCHQMETFSALLAICAGNSPVSGEFPAQRPVTRSFDVYFDLSLNKRLSKQSWGCWFETLSCPLWRQCNGWPSTSRCKDTLLARFGLMYMHILVQNNRGWFLLQCRKVILKFNISICIFGGIMRCFRISS